MPTYAQNIKIETKYANGIIFSEVDLPVYIVQYLGFYLCTFLGTVVPKRGGGGGGRGARGAVLPFAFQYDSNEANAC